MLIRMFFPVRVPCGADWDCWDSEKARSLPHGSGLEPLQVTDCPMIPVYRADNFCRAWAVAWQNLRMLPEGKMRPPPAGHMVCAKQDLLE